MMVRAAIRMSLACVILSGVILAGTGPAALGAGLRDFVGPRFAFEAQSPPPAPDYAQEAAWAVRPGHPGASAAHPPGTSPADPKTAPADVFFIYPTSFHSEAAWNAAIEDEDTNRQTDERSIRNQASVFNGCCRIFAPRYRQATLGAFFTPRKEDARQALDLAYGDVLKAFDYYIAHDNGGRPFIIASHSQGSRHAVQLLNDRIAHDAKLRARFVAAYIIGTGIPEDVFSRNYKTIAPCRSATDLGCVISWSSYAEGANPRWTRTAITQRYDDGEESNSGKPILCTNPLSWTTGSEKAPASLNLGAWVLRGDEVRPPRAGYTGARCEDGALFTEVETGGEPGGARLARLRNEHVLDYQLFYMNIRANAAARVKAFLAGRPQ
jgi:Protein of unknown function (DUF3089)